MNFFQQKFYSVFIYLAANGFLGKPWQVHLGSQEQKVLSKARVIFVMVDAVVSRIVDAQVRTPSMTLSATSAVKLVSYLILSNFYITRAWNGVACVGRKQRKGVQKMLLWLFLWQLIQHLVTGTERKRW